MKEELLVDTYYMYNFTGKTPGMESLTPPGLRAYDTMSNSFTLSYAKFALQIDADPVTVRADLGYGTLAYLISGGVPMGNATASAFAAQQAFVSVKVPGTPLSIDMGRFNTTAGAEVIEANRNWIYSRSLLFFIIPVTHTGARLNLKINDMISLQGTVANGIANDQPDNNANKTVGLSLAVTPLPSTSIYATTYFQKDGPPGMEGDTHFTGDLVVAHNISDVLGLNLNFDYIKIGDAYATGAALMGRYVVGEHLTVAARGEFLKDKGLLVPMGDTAFYEGTLTLGIPFAGHAEIRAELRGDFAADPYFDSGDETMELKKNQFTGTIAFLGFL